MTNDTSTLSPSAIVRSKHVYFCNFVNCQLLLVELFSTASQNILYIKLMVFAAVFVQLWSNDVKFGRMDEVFSRPNCNLNLSRKAFGLAYEMWSWAHKFVYLYKLDTASMILNTNRLTLQQQRACLSLSRYRKLMFGLKLFDAVRQQTFTNILHHLEQKVYLLF